MIQIQSNKTTKMSEDIEEFPNSKIKVIQDKEKFCFGIDAVLLAHFARCKGKIRMADLGTGTGIIPLLFSYLNSEAKIDALEIQNEQAEAAQRSVCLNNLQERIKIHKGDIKNPFAFLKKNSYDLVTSNPPYIKTDSGTHNKDDAKSIARHEILCTLDDVCRCASDLLKSKGKFCMIHKPQRLSEIFDSLKKYCLEPKEIQFVQPARNREPNMVMIKAVKNAARETRILPALCVYDDENKRTAEVDSIYGLW